ncbi:uncharacterized protein LOC119262653 [Pygocentrus nattereri]|uniref:uncharacterized protein LOC119262653 n=1 Tax=Pygocentrus nattereri TaxID=42514 RepID=UPI001891E5BD|nr:uncharacterized protein LOC119262653 [Pygocentrus nattereri]
MKKWQFTGLAATHMENGKQCSCTWNLQQELLHYSCRQEPRFWMRSSEREPRYHWIRPDVRFFRADSGPRSQYRRPEWRDYRPFPPEITRVRGPVNRYGYSHFPNRGNNVNFSKPQERDTIRTWTKNHSASALQNPSGKQGAAPAKQRTKQNNKHKNRKHNKKNTNTNLANPQTNTQDKNSATYKRFTGLVRSLFNLMRSHHHMEMVAANAETEPPTFSRLTAYLSKVVKPANITPQTRILLEGNARNWAYTTRLILTEHYQTHISQETAELIKVGVQDMREALEVATRWYQKRYPKKYMGDAVNSVEKLFPHFKAHLRL